MWLQGSSSVHAFQLQWAECVPPDNSWDLWTLVGGDLSYNRRFWLWLPRALHRKPSKYTSIQKVILEPFHADCLLRKETMNTSPAKSEQNGTHDMRPFRHLGQHTPVAVPTNNQLPLQTWWILTPGLYIVTYRIQTATPAAWNIRTAKWSRVTRIFIAGSPFYLLFLFFLRRRKLTGIVSL